jgi:hypothetical protein
MMHLSIGANDSPRPLQMRPDRLVVQSRSIPELLTLSVLAALPMISSSSDAIPRWSLSLSDTGLLIGRPYNVMCEYCRILEAKKMILALNVKESADRSNAQILRMGPDKSFRIHFIPN